jgi:hypothetical protein
MNMTMEDLFLEIVPNAIAQTGIRQVLETDLFSFQHSEEGSPPPERMIE